MGKHPKGDRFAPKQPQTEREKLEAMAKTLGIDHQNKSDSELRELIKLQMDKPESNESDDDIAKYQDTPQTGTSFADKLKNTIAPPPKNAPPPEPTPPTESTSSTEAPPPKPTEFKTTVINENTPTKKLEKKLFWFRVVLAGIGGIIATFAFEDISGEERRWASIGFMIILFVASGIVAKTWRIPVPRSDRKKYATAGIGSYVFFYLFMWILSYTLVHANDNVGSMPFT